MRGLLQFLLQLRSALGHLLEALGICAINPSLEGHGCSNLLFLIRLLDADEVDIRREEVADSRNGEDDLLAEGDLLLLLGSLFRRGVRGFRGRLARVASTTFFSWSGESVSMMLAPQHILPILCSHGCRHCCGRSCRTARGRSSRSLQH